MKNRFLDGGNSGGCSIHGKKHNKCVVFPVEVCVVAEAIDRRNMTWIVRAKVPAETDLIVQVGDSSFHVHKLAMVSKSAYLNRLVFQKRNNNLQTSIPTIVLHDLPGGSETFELILKFCYGWKIDLTPTNIAPIYSAANFLEMNNGMEQGNLISKAETFLTYLLLASSWKDIFAIFRSCEGAISSWAGEFRILKAGIENLIKRLPPEQESSVPCNFLLHLLKFGNSVRADSALLAGVEERVALKLEGCRVSDLLVQNSTNGTLYDVEIVAKVLEKYVSCAARNPVARVLLIGRLIDEYLTVVSRDSRLLVKSFSSLAEALPDSARVCHDNLYRAIDFYLKVHPKLTEEERTGLCRAMDYHKLSQEAQKHAMKNERLPLRMSTAIIMVEQAKMARSMTCEGSNYPRSAKSSQASLKMGNCSSTEKGWVYSPRNEIRMMKKEVEAVRFQISELQVCRLKMQQQLKRCHFV